MGGRFLWESRDQMVSRGNGGRIRYQSLPKKSIKGGGGGSIDH